VCTLIAGMDDGPFAVSRTATRETIGVASQPLSIQRHVDRDEAPSHSDVALPSPVGATISFDNVAVEASPAAGSGDADGARDVEQSAWLRAGEQATLTEMSNQVDVSRYRSRWARCTAFLGPAILIAVGYMDPGNWATSE